MLTQGAEAGYVRKLPGFRSLQMCSTTWFVGALDPLPPSSVYLVALEALQIDHQSCWMCHEIEVY